MITLTETARMKISDILTSTSREGLRLAVIPGGCAGVRYDLKLSSAPLSGDVVMKDGTAVLFVDADSMPVLDGTCIDFVTNAGGGGFTFSNPNAVARCSCSGAGATCAGRCPS